MKKILLLLSVIALSTIALANHVPLEMSKGKSIVSFEALGTPGMLTVHGKSEDHVTGTLFSDGQSLSGTVSLALNSLDTGLNLRNDHMKNKYLEIAKYPDASITITKLDVPANGSPFNGILSLHGIKKPISGTANVEQDGDNLKLKVNFAIMMDEFGITQPSFAGVTIARQVKIEALAVVPTK